MKNLKIEEMKPVSGWGEKFTMPCDDVKHHIPILRKDLVCVTLMESDLEQIVGECEMNKERHLVTLSVDPDTCTHII